MAFVSNRIALVASTSTPLFGPGSTGPILLASGYGNVGDAIPVRFKNEDATAIVYWGGVDVDDTNGQSVDPGETVTMNVYGESEVPWVWSSDTPVVSLVLGRQ